MAATWRSYTKWTSIILRISTYVYLRWALIPFFTIFIWLVAGGNLAAFTRCYQQDCQEDSKYEVVDDKADVVVKELVVLDDDESDTPDGDGAAVVEEINVQETILLREKPQGALRTLLLGIPNPKSLTVTAATLLINLLCALMVGDRYVHEQAYPGTDLSFIRVGYVSDSEARLLIREPDQAKMPVTVEIRIKEPHGAFEPPIWTTAGGVRWTSNDTDYTATLTVPLRYAKSRRYEWRSSNNHSGEFLSAPSPGASRDIFDGKFTFLSTSCIISRVPYSPFDHPLAIPGMRHLAKVLPDLGAQFMLFLGDFIYVDVPRRYGLDIESYRRKYRQVYASPDWPAVGQNLSWIHVLDDHEIANDWSKGTSGIYQTAIEPWNHYHKGPNPPLASRPGPLFTRSEATWFEFSQGPASFFMLDTRKYRSSNNLPATDQNKTMLGAEQLDDLLAFLKRSEPRGVKWKFIASSVPFTKNWRINTKDTWGGFLIERKRVLEAMWDASANGYGVIVLSGDRHEFGATKFPPPANSSWAETATVYEFSASPLSQFYSPIPSYFQTDDEDVKLKYINGGNTKFGAITIDTVKGSGRSSLKYRLFINGVEAWDTVVLSPDVDVSEKHGSIWKRLGIS